MSLSSSLNTTKLLFQNLFYVIFSYPKISSQMDVLEGMQKGKLYIENVRDFFKIPYDNAEFLCEEAVQDGLLIRHWGYLCPNDKQIIGITDNPEEDNNVYKCQICESKDVPKFEFDNFELDLIKYYSIKDAHG